MHHVREIFAHIHAGLTKKETKSGIEGRCTRLLALQLLHALQTENNDRENRSRFIMICKRRLTTYV